MKLRLEIQRSCFPRRMEELFEEKVSDFSSYSRVAVLLLRSLSRLTGTGCSEERSTPEHEREGSEPVLVIGVRLTSKYSTDFSGNELLD